MHRVFHWGTTNVQNASHIRVAAVYKLKEELDKNIRGLWKWARKGECPKQDLITAKVLELRLPSSI